MELALPTFVKLLYSPNADLRDQAVFALGILAGSSPTCRDCVLGHGAFGPLLELFKEDLKLSMLRNATWTLSNLFGGIPRHSLEKVALQALKSLLCNDDWEVLSDSCTVLTYLSRGTFNQRNGVIKAGVSPRLVELLRHHSSSVVISALQAIGNIVAVEGRHVKDILGALQYLLSLSTDKDNMFIKKEAEKDNMFITKEACYVISHITFRKKDQIQAVIDAGLIEPLVKLLKTADVDTCVRAALAISNAASGGSCEQIKYLASKGCIEALCNLVVRSSDPSILCPCLDGLYYIMKNGGVHLYNKLIRDAAGFKRILVLAKGEDTQVSHKAWRSLMFLYRRSL